MTKGRKNRRGGYNGNSADTVAVRGHAVIPLVTEADPSGAQRFTLHPTAVDIYRLADLCAVYEQYRFNKLKVSFCRGDGVVCALAAYTPCDSSSSASNSLALSAVDQMCIAFPGQTTVASMKIPRTPLHGPKDWYECSDVASGPGEFWFSNLSETGVGVGGTGLVRFDYDISFYGRVPTAVTSHAWLNRTTLQQFVKDAESMSEDSDECELDSVIKALRRKKYLKKGAS